ncbi:hypothetical protein T484DRAFT_2026107 [Baffinella frigidus]|nr:hypothetical protein T484DRAFT_2026107 [Cryptophyta sp. CCMP2293]
MSAAGKLLAGLARPIAQRAAPRAPSTMRSMSELSEQLSKVKDVPLKDAPGFVAGMRNDPKARAAAKTWLDMYHAEYIQTGSFTPVYHVIIFMWCIGYANDYYGHLRHECAANGSTLIWSK